MFAAEIRRKRVHRMRQFTHWKWHLDEMYVKINGEMHYLWRAMDHEGEVLESFVTKERDKAAALKFIKKDLRRHGRPRAIVTDGLEYEVYARVADAAHRLCELRLNGGDSRGAMDAVRTGLRIAPDDELLWRDLLTAAHATGQENMLYAAAGEIWTRASMDGPPELTTETEALLDELLPTWRWTLA